MKNNTTELSINTEVVEKMAEIAAGEIDGVVGVLKRAIDLKGAVKSGNAFKGVKIESVNGAIKINIYINVKKDAKVKDVAEKVQANIKEKVQNMTGSVVTKVNVIVADIDMSEEKTEE